MYRIVEQKDSSWVKVYNRDKFVAMFMNRKAAKKYVKQLQKKDADAQE